MINNFESSRNSPIPDSEKVEDIIITQQDLNTIRTGETETKVADPEILPPPPTEDSHTSREIPLPINTTTEEMKRESKVADFEVLSPALAQKVQISRLLPPHCTPYNEEVKSESKLADSGILQQKIRGEIELIKTVPPLTIDTKEGENFRKRSPEYKQSYSDNDDDFVQETPIKYTLKRSLSANTSPTNQYHQERNHLQKQSKPSFSAYVFSNRQFSSQAFQSSTNITDAAAILSNRNQSLQPVGNKLSIQQITPRTSTRLIPGRTSMRPTISKISAQRSPITLREISDEIALRYLNIKNNNQDCHDLLTLDIEQALIEEGDPEQTITPQLIRILNEKIFHILEESKQALERKRQIQPAYNQSHITINTNMSTTNQSYTQNPGSSSSKLSPQEPYEAWTDEQPYPITPTIAQQQEEEEAVYSDAIHTWLQLSLSEQLKYNVLSIDGGGVRGIVACRLIQEIEDRQLNALREIQPQSTIRIQDFFDIYTGTSIGGIIAVGLLLQDMQGNFLYHPRELKDILINNASVIFQQSTIRCLKQLFKPIYSNKNLKLLIETMILGNHLEVELDRAGIKYTFTAYNDNIGSTANNNPRGNILHRVNKIKKLSDIKTCGKNIRLIVPSYDIQNKKILIFDSEITDKDFSLVDICMATSAAPRYFPTYPVTPINDNTARYNCVDGGLFLNFPASVTISKLIDHCMIKPQIYTVSITTGSAGDVTENNREKRRGLIRWIRKGLIDLLMRTPTQLAENIVDNCVKDHIRLSVMLQTAAKDMDNSTPSNIDNLIRDTEHYININPNLFTRIVSEVPLISNNIPTTITPANITYSMLGHGPITPVLSQYAETGFPIVVNNTPTSYNPVNGAHKGTRVLLPPFPPSSQYYPQERGNVGDDDENDKVPSDMKDI